MAKRFISTELFDDEWFAELDQESKIFWIYYLTKCDHAGLLKNNKRLIEFQCGIKSLDTVIKQLANRIIKVTETLFFCPKFLDFQYPGFPECEFRAAKSAKDILLKNGIDYHELKKVDKELANSYGNGISKGKSKSNGNGNGKITGRAKKIEVPEFPEYQECMTAYFEFFKKLNGVEPEIKPQDGKALKNLITHFRTLAKDGSTVADGLRYIFANWHKLDAFTQKQIDLAKIHANINSIITQVKTVKKNGPTNTSNTDYESPEFRANIDSKLSGIYGKQAAN